MREPYIGVDFSGLPKRLNESDHADELRKPLREAIRIWTEAKCEMRTDGAITFFADNNTLLADEFEPTNNMKKTRYCTMPWWDYQQLCTGAWTCCFHFSKAGTIEGAERLEDCLNSPRIRQVRRELLTGDLRSGCQTCCRIPACTVEELKELVEKYYSKEDVDRRYSPEIRNEAVKLVVDDGLSVGDVSLMFSISTSSIEGWVDCYRKGTLDNIGVSLSPVCTD